MRAVIYGLLLLVLASLSSPATSEAFSRRSHSSEVGPTQSFTTQKSQTSTNDQVNNSAQPVPEPPVLLLMTVGLGALGLFAAIRKFRAQE